MQKRKLGKTDIEITPIGLGCWQFSNGGGMMGGYWGSIAEEEVEKIVAISYNGGINWFDTAEAYGHGTSERALTDALKSCGIDSSEVVIADKWNPVLRFASTITGTFKEREDALHGYPVGLYQIHNPASLSSLRAQMKAMAELAKEGKIKAVGVSNFSANMMRHAYQLLQNEGVTLASNQMHYNLLHRNIEKDGVMDAARELGITIIAYSPLAQGVLTGKFHNNPAMRKSRSMVRRLRGTFSKRNLERSRPLVDELRNIASKNDARPAQVALNWLVTAHGDMVVAIPGASSSSQAEQNAAAMDFTLTEEEIRKLDDLSRDF
jgi:aryl-alcohol dehydrogenase-like predicted oxidoreductase